jgi:hypothetical protein
VEPTVEQMQPVVQPVVSDQLQQQSHVEKENEVIVFMNENAKRRKVIVPSACQYTQVNLENLNRFNGMLTQPELNLNENIRQPRYFIHMVPDHLTQPLHLSCESDDAYDPYNQNPTNVSLPFFLNSFSFLFSISIWYLNTLKPTSLL